MSLSGYAEHTEQGGWEAAMFKVACPRELCYHSEHHWDKSAPSHHERTVLSHCWPHRSFASGTRKVLTLLTFISQAYYLEMWAWDTHIHKQTDMLLATFSAGVRHWGRMLVFLHGRKQTHLHFFLFKAVVKYLQNCFKGDRERQHKILKFILIFTYRTKGSLWFKMYANVH